MKSLKNDFKIIHAIKQQELNPEAIIINVNSKEEAIHQIFHRIYKSILKGNKVIFLVNDLKKIKDIWSSIVKFFEAYEDVILKPTLISSNSKSQVAYKHLVEEEKFDECNLIFTTSVLNVGINICESVQIDYIFNYTQNYGRIDANSHLQLMFRDRTRTSKVYCYANIFDEDKNINKSSLLTSKRSFKEVYDSNSSYGKINAKQEIRINELEVRENKNVNQLKITLENIQNEYLPFEKTLAAFVQLAKVNNCAIEYDFFENSNSTESVNVSKHSSDLFVINMLKALITIPASQRIRITPLVTTKSNSREIFNDFRINTSKEEFIDDERITLVESEYHLVFQKDVDKIQRYYNYLRMYYSVNLKKVFNFILHTYNDKKTFINKIDSFVVAHKLLSKQYSILTSVIIDKIKPSIYDSSLYFKNKEVIKNIIKLRLAESSYEDLKKITSDNFIKYLDEIFY